MNRRRVAGITVVLAALIAPAAVDGAFPGSNGRIFFDTGGPGRDIVSVDPQGGDRTKVTQGQEPAVSPNGRVIAFVRRGDIYLSNKLGGDERQLTDTPIVERTPSWSPHGNQLVFATDRRNGVGGDIVSIRGDGSDRERLTVSEHADFSPSYSPSGNKIVFVRAFNHPGVRQILKIDSDGSNRVAAHFIELLLVRPSDLVAGRQPDRVRALRPGLPVALFDRARRFERVAVDLREGQHRPRAGVLAQRQQNRLPWAKRPTAAALACS